jgi:hypothetical protein
MPRFTSFSSHVENLIKKLHQAINTADHTTIKNLWLNEESISLLDHSGELSLGIEDIMEVLKSREHVKVDILGCKSHSFAGLIITETLEAWSYLPQSEHSQQSNQTINNPTDLGALHTQQNPATVAMEYSGLIKNDPQLQLTENSTHHDDTPEVEYIYGTYISTQNYPDWQFMRIHLSYANYGAVSYRCFENIQGFH